MRTGFSFSHFGMYVNDIARMEGFYTRILEFTVTDRGQLAGWDWQEAARVLDVPPAKFGRLLTLQDAIRAAVRNWPGANPSTV